MSKIDLSAFVTSMAKSVDEAVTEMQKAKVSTSLEEFECTLTILADVDVEPLKTPTVKAKISELKGLKLLQIHKAKPLKPSKVSVPEQPQNGTLTIRAVFSPGEKS